MTQTNQQDEEEEQQTGGTTTPPLVPSWKEGHHLQPPKNIFKGTLQEHLNNMAQQTDTQQQDIDFNITQPHIDIKNNTIEKKGGGTLNLTNTPGDYPSTALKNTRNKIYMGPKQTKTIEEEEP